MFYFFFFSSFSYTCLFIYFFSLGQGLIIIFRLWERHLTAIIICSGKEDWAGRWAALVTCLCYYVSLFIYWR